MISVNDIVTVTVPNSSSFGRNARVLEVAELTNVSPGCPTHRYRLKFFNSAVTVWYYSDEVAATSGSSFEVGDTVVLHVAPAQVYMVTGKNEDAELSLRLIELNGRPPHPNTEIPISYSNVPAHMFRYPEESGKHCDHCGAEIAA